MKTICVVSTLTTSIVALFGVLHEAQAASKFPFSCGSGDPSTCLETDTSVSNGTAIWGNDAAGNGYGVFGSGHEGVRGLGTGVAGVGVHGFSSATGFGAGVSGETSSTLGYGVYGEANGSGRTGVFGNAKSGATDSKGVFGYAVNSGTGVYAQLGFPASGAFALYSNGPAGGTSSWFSGSDARLKKGIKDARYGLQEILKLRAVTYELKDHPEEGTHVGFIAQEVQPIVPEVVHADTSGMLSLTYTDLIPVMAKAIQEQQKVIERLERERSPVMTSSFSGGLGGGLALGLLPLGIIAALRRRREPQV